MSFRSLLPNLLNFRPGEGRLLWLFLVLFFLRGICDVFFATAASTLYLEHFSAASLPWVYVASAAVVTILGFGYARLASRTSVSVLLKVTLAFVVVSISALHLLLAFAGSRWWAMGLMVWREALYMLMNATFWAQIGILFNVRQGKRLFPLMAGGDIIAVAAGGAIIPFVVRQIGVMHLLYFAEVSIALCLVVTFAIDRAARGVAIPAAESQEEPDRRPLTSLLKDRYLALFFGVSTLSFLIFHFVDYNFYAVVNQRIKDPTALASFFGTYSAVVNALGLLVNGVIAGRVLGRYGLLAGWLVVPLFVGAGTLAALGLPALGVPAVFFWAIVGTKLMDEMLRGAFLHPTYKILYQPLPPRERVRVQAVRDSIVEPVAIGLSGVVLLVLTRAAGFAVWQICLVLLGMLALFAVLSVVLRMEYIRVLGNALARRRPLDAGLLPPDATSVRVLRRSARLERPAEGVTSLVQLGDAAVPDLLAKLAAATKRADAARVVRTLGRIGTTTAIAALTEQMRHPDENVRHAVLEALSRAGYVARLASTRVGAALKAELANAAWLLACRADLEGEERAELVRRSLDNELDEARDRVLLLLSFRYARETVLSARTVLRYGSHDQRAQALEAVDNLLPRRVREAVVPLFEELSLSDRLDRLTRVFAQERRNASERLAEMIEAPVWGLSSWSRACAVHAGEGRGGRVAIAVRGAARDQDPLVRETAVGVIERGA